MPGARMYVDPPLFTPGPYGLLTAVDYPDASDPHWQQGINYQPNCASPQSTYDECIAVTGTGGPPSPPAFINSVSILPRGATPFSVFCEFDCSLVGNPEAEAQTSTAVKSSESWQVERSFWTGLAGGQTIVFPHLAANAQVLDGPGATATATSILLQSAATIVGASEFGNPATALSVLEGALADCYNGIGIIHIPQHALETFAAYGLAKPNGPRMYTPNGNKIAVGAGYPGTSPAGVARAVNKSWIYATGNIMAYKGALNVRANGAQVIDKAKNTRKMIVDRRWLLGWDCCHFAAQVNLGTPSGT